MGGCGSTIPTKIYLRNHRILVEEKTEMTGDQLDPKIKAKKKELYYSATRVRNIFAKLNAT